MKSRHSKQSKYSEFDVLNSDDFNLTPGDRTPAQDTPSNSANHNPQSLAFGRADQTFKEQDEVQDRPAKVANERPTTSIPKSARSRKKSEKSATDSNRAKPSAPVSQARRPDSLPPITTPGANGSSTQEEQEQAAIIKKAPTSGHGGDSHSAHRTPQQEFHPQEHIQQSYSYDITQGPPVRGQPTFNEIDRQLSVMDLPKQRLKQPKPSHDRQEKIIDNVLHQISSTSAPRKEPIREKTLLHVVSEGSEITPSSSHITVAQTDKGSKAILQEFEKLNAMMGDSGVDIKKKLSERLSTMLVNHYITNQKTKYEKKKEEMVKKIKEEGNSDDSFSYGDSSKSPTQVSIPGYGKSKSSIFFEPVSEPGEPKKKHMYPPGFTSADDLDGDGIIDPIESQIKTHLRKNQIRDEIEQRIKNEYLSRFKQEVDIHHKIAYKFERAYKLGRTNPEKQTELDLEVIDLLSDFSEYIQHDPMVLFYCLFFCIIYNNPFLVEFLRTLIRKLSLRDTAVNQKFEFMLDFIDMNGLERVRTIGDTMNTKVYHIVMYQAFNDKLRVIYSKIITKLKGLQIRNKDAVRLLNTRDYSIISEIFRKQSIKVVTTPLFENRKSACNNYRQYNPAFFEEVLLDPIYNIDKRVAQNYRERFLTTSTAVYQVLLMYSKQDYMDNFLEMDKIQELTKKQMIDLFSTCIRHDAFKLGLQIYCRFMKGPDFSLDLMNKVNQSIRDSTKFMEIKLFFIHEHFGVLDVEGLNSLIDVLLLVLRRLKYHTNPIMSCYNPVKVALLVYKVSFKIEQLNIYSLITKCQLINKLVETSLNKFLEQQSNIGQLFSFMNEPILDLKRQEDSLDIMLQMNMRKVLNHPVIIEVLNLVYEGKYSVDTSPLYLSQTFNVFFSTDLLDNKNQVDRLTQNIKSMTEPNQNENQKQFTLQFHIWKNCIQQRLLDETFFIIVASMVYFYQTYLIEEFVKEFARHENEVFGHHLDFQQHELEMQPLDKLQQFCPIVVDQLVGLSRCLNFLAVEDTIISLSMLTSVLQKFAIKKLKNNAAIDTSNIILEITSSILNVLYLQKIIKHEVDPVFTNVCQGIIHISEEEMYLSKHGFYYLTDFGHFNSYQILISCNVFIFALYTILQLKRTEQFGSMVIMIGELINEMIRYFIAFGVVIFIFFGSLRFTAYHLKHDHVSFYQSFLDVVDAFIGQTRIEEFKSPYGHSYILIITYFSRMFLFSFMVAMIIFRYREAWANIEAKRRMDIISLKNSQQYDPKHGAITMSYFPVNLFLLPFMFPLLIMKSERFNHTILQMQYYLLMGLYVFIAGALAIPVAPLLYLKLVINAGYHMICQKNCDSTKGQSCCLKFGNFLFTLFLGPFIIGTSFLADLINLNGILMKEEKHFEFKYQKQNLLQGTGPQVIMKSFFKTFIIDYARKYKGKGQSEFSIMFMHRRVFSIVDNFHSVYCRGDKTYDEAIYDIRLYNYTKVLGRQCSIPSKTGEKRQDYLNYDVIASVFEDIVMYNYFLFCVQQFKAGVNFESKKALIYKYGYAYRNYDMKAHQFCSSLTRDPSDFFNFFCITQTTKAFTDVGDIAKNYQLETNFMHERKQTIQVDKMKADWNKELLECVEDHVWKMKDIITSSKSQVNNKIQKAMKLRQLKYRMSSFQNLSEIKGVLLQSYEP